jgi:hypothetical protein
MDRQPQTPQEPADRSPPVDGGPDQDPHQTQATPSRPTLAIGPLFVRTVRHFFPDFNAWLDDIPDGRAPQRLVYDKRFLLWLGLLLFVCKLGSRRQLDFQLGEVGTQVLANLNRLANTQHTQVACNKTVDNFLAGSVGSDSGPLADLRRHVIYRLVRQRVLDDARLLGQFVLLIDGTGYLVFRQPHCEHCLTRQHGDKTLYLHQVLEAKLVGPAGMVLSIATEFIDNRDVAATPLEAGEQKRKQDCELKALRRLAARLRQDFPQLPLCLNGDGLYACGEGFQIAKDFRLSFLYVFQEGRLPALWREFQELLRLCPEQKVEVETPCRVQQVYRWVNALDYVDSDGRSWSLNALQCHETRTDGTKSLWAWLTCLPLNRQTAAAVATDGGRQRWGIENQGFNVQKNSELNLEHAYSEGSHWEAYYYLLQIAHLLLQLLEKGSLLRRLAQQQGKSNALAWLGSLKNIAERLRESLRNWHWPQETFDAEVRMQIRFDSS